MDKYSLPLTEGGYYHIYNQGNNKEKIFFSSDNYNYFLHKFDAYLSDFVDVYAFCLMPNHFHFLIRIKELDVDIRHSISSRYGMSMSIEKTEIIISEMFRRLFLSYSKSINKQLGRTGSLFRKNFKRKEITSLHYLQQAIVYIHRNPLHHDFVDDFHDYPWSSYDRIINKKTSKLKKSEVVELFGDRANYQYVHNFDVEDDLE